jgi:hypothetical protein
MLKVGGPDDVNMLQHSVAYKAIAQLFRYTLCKSRGLLIEPEV